MDYKGVVARSARLTGRNPFAVVLVSVATTISFVPFVAGILFAGTVGGLIGLWTSSMLFGFVATGGARLMAAVTERELSTGFGYFQDGIRSARVMGPAVGIGTFVSTVVALGLVLLPVGGVLGMSLVLIGIYVVAGWFVTGIFALTVWASFENSTDVRGAFSRGWELLFRNPAAVAWLLIQTVGWTLLSIPLMIAPVLLLPGYVQLLGTVIVQDVVERS